MSAPGPRPSARSVAWHVCWAGLTLLVLLLTLNALREVHRLLTTEATMARNPGAEALAAARDRPRPASPELSEFVLTPIPRSFPISFTTRDGREVRVTADIARMPYVPAITIRYDPAAPETSVTLHRPSDVWWRLISALLSLWLLVPAILRAARGQTGGWRLFLPPWPFR